MTAELHHEGDQVRLLVALSFVELDTETDAETRHHVPAGTIGHVVQPADPQQYIVRFEDERGDTTELLVAGANLEPIDQGEPPARRI